MNRKHTFSYFKTALALATLSLMVVAVTACGTLQVSVEESPEPPAVATEAATPTPAETPLPDPKEPEAPIDGPEPTATAAWLSLTTYIHPVFGYEIPIPEGAHISEGEPEEPILFTNRDPSAGTFTYFIGVQVLTNLPESAAQSPTELVQWLSANESGVSAVTPAGSNGAQVVFDSGAGQNCAEIRSLLAAFLNQGVGYAVRLASDDPERCDAAAVDEFATIVDGFSPPAHRPILPMTPTPTPALAGATVVVYAKDDNVWLWTESDGERQLTKDGGVAEVLLSDDKQVIAFRRGNGLWAVNSDGSGERQLVKESDLQIPELGELTEFVTGIRPSQVAWVPGTHQLLFNTSPEMAGPGLFLSDDLWLVNADTSSLVNLFAPGEGGNFAIAPDGRQVALVRPGVIYLADIAGNERRLIFSHTPVVTYSEFQYYARPLWAPEGDSLRVVIPPADPAAADVQAYSIWHLYTDGASARLIGSIESRVGQEPVIAPDLSHVAFLSAPNVEPGRTDLLLMPLGEMLGNRVFYTSRVEAFGSWSPGSQRFSFSRLGEQSISTSIGRLGEEPRTLGDDGQAVIDVRWLDDDRFVYVQASSRGWALLLGDVSGTVIPIAGIVGPPPAFDVSG